MSNASFYNKFESLPAEAKKQVIAFMDSLQKEYSLKNKKGSKSFVKNAGFIGMWEDNNEMSDSSVWVSNVRKKEWKEIDK